MPLTFSPGLAAALAAAASRTAWVAAVVSALGASRTITARRADAGDAWAGGVTFRAATLTGGLATAGGSITSFGQIGAVSTQLAANLATGTAVVRIAAADGQAWVQGTLGLPGSGADWTVRANPSAANGFAFGSTFRLTAPAALPEGAAPPPPLPAPPPPPPPPPPPVGTVITALALVEEAGQAGTYPYTAAVRLQPGAVPAGSVLQSPDDATLRAAVLASHPDGSPMLAVVGGTATLAANGSASIRLQAGAPAPGAALTAARIAELAPAASVVFTGGVSATMTLDPAATPTRTWWASQQHVCASWVQPVPGTASLCVVWVVHAWAGTGRVRVEATIENSLVNIASLADFVPAGYSAVVTIGGQAQPAVLATASPEGDSHRGARAWYASGWIGGSQSVRATMQHTYLQTLPELFRIDQAASFDMAGYAADAYTPWGNGRIVANNMGGGGDVPGIGPLPQWECRTLQTGSRHGWRATEASALSALTYNVNTRSVGSGLVPTFAEVGTRAQGFGWPRFVPAGDGGGTRGWEVAHAPDIGLMAFYGRPTPVFIELAQKIAVWSGTWSASSNGSFTWQAGVAGFHYQTRGKAWTIRAIAHAALLSPDSIPWRAAAATALERNVALLETYRDESRNLLGTVFAGRPGSFSDLRGAVPGMQQAVWEHHFLVGVLHRAQRAVGHLLGADAARFSALADWAARQPVRLVRESTGGEWRFVPYLETIANNNVDATNGTAQGSGVHNNNVLQQEATWGAQRAARWTGAAPALAGGWRTHPGPVQSYADPGWVEDTVGGYYYVEPFVDALACAVERGVTEASQAWGTVSSSITNWQGWRAGFAADPRFGASPRSGVTPYYEGQGTFTTLQGVRDGIASTGGWAQLPNTRLSDVLPTAAQLDAISPRPVLRGNTWPNTYYSIWGSAAWTGHAFFVGATGGHYSYWGNDLACVRIADPPAAMHLYMPAPIAAVAHRGTANGYLDHQLVPAANWGSLAVSGAVEHSWPAWGPRAVHQYSGMMWHAPTKQVLLGGSNQSSCRNPTAVGQIAQIEARVWAYDPSIPDPQTAWRSAVFDPAASNGAFGFLQNANGTVSFRYFGNLATLDPASMTLTTGAPGPSPRYDQYSPWRNVIRDPATGKHYELNRSDLGNPYINPPYRLSLFETTSAGYVSVAQLPAEFVSLNADQMPGIVIINSVAYLWGGTATVVRIDLAAGTVQTYTGAEVIPAPLAGYNGVWGRWAWVPQAQCFVGLASEGSNAFVFRPPSGWI
jgi:hypothetical protein